jgi:cytochrome c peroxidase
MANIGKALAAYQRRLISGRSDFDVFADALRRNDPVGQTALSESAKRGLRLFIGSGNCRLCHSGPNFSDMEFHSTFVRPLNGGRATDAGRYAGAQLVVLDVFNARGPYSDDAEGAAARKLELLSNRPEMWGQFRTPSLRNVAATPPYMHQGQLASLDAVIQHYSDMAQTQDMGHHKQETVLRPLRLSVQEVADMKAFLESLTDDSIDPALRVQPASPSLPADESAGELRKVPNGSGPG